MTDAQKAAWEETKASLNARQRRVAEIIKTWPGSTIDLVMKKHQSLFNYPIEKNAAAGRLSELADLGIIYACGRESGQSRYFYEPDQACRFRIRQAREGEAFRRWARKGMNDYLDRLPDHVRAWMENTLR